jgi:excisionase family DNA binding protein
METVCSNVFMDSEMAAYFLKIKLSTLYAWVHAQRIPYRKHGSKLAFSTADLSGWSAAQAVPVVDCMALTFVAPKSRKPSRSLKIKRTVDRNSSKKEL